MRIKEALWQGHPVNVGFNANANFAVASWKQGVVSKVFEDDICIDGLCGHAALVVGYDNDAEVQGGGCVI